MLQAQATITLGAGCYTLRAPLASSAYGVIWRARAPQGGDVAIKLINREQMARCAPAQRTRWIASARKEIAFLDTLSPWDERHIVRLLDNGAHEGLPVLALELMESDLARHIAEHGAVEPGQALDWIGQVNQALAKVHQYGWHYLDLKPANVLLAGGAVKLADFGTSRPSADGASAVYAGTASWQAPEQFFPSADGHYASEARSDYFALGALLYFLVTGSQLHFCRACGDAWRDFHKLAPRTLLEQWQGRMAPTLAAAEADSFARHAGAPALALLAQLIAAKPDDRPAHALAISRLIDTARRSLP
jgi:serine/threonine protein kinase